MEGFWKGERVPGEVELAIWRAGEGEDPLILIHGITAQHRIFNDVARSLAGEYALVGVDLRGRGDSGKPETGYGLDAHAGDVVRVLDHLGLESAVLVGHSMGAFVGLQAALTYPDRVRSLMLLDGGWPRQETTQEEMTGEQQEEAEELREGLERSFSRLEMVFEGPEDYLEFWFPGQGLTFEDLPQGLADYYRYDLGEVEGGYQPKASLAAVRADSPQISSSAPTADEMRGVRCPAALVRPTSGFFQESDPLISEPARAAMGEALDLHSDTVLSGANHYTMMFEPYAPEVSDSIRDFLRRG
ncbi:MAG: alpha/beta hydrolase [Rubrobacteraceae bacterium]